MASERSKVERRVVVRAGVTGVSDPGAGDDRTAYAVVDVDAAAAAADRCIALCDDVMREWRAEAQRLDLDGDWDLSTVADARMHGAIQCAEAIRKAFGR